MSWTSDLPEYIRSDNGPEFAAKAVRKAKVLVEAWRKTYNRIRPHSSLGYRPPVPEAHVVGSFTLGLAEC